MTIHCYTVTDVELISSKSLLDGLLKQFDSIESFGFELDPCRLGYIMTVQTKDPDFRWIIEDF